MMTDGVPNIKKCKFLKFEFYYCPNNNAYFDLHIICVVQSMKGTL